MAAGNFFCKSRFPNLSRSSSRSKLQALTKHANMAPEKRKSAPTNESFLRSKPSAENDNRPAKRSKPEAIPKLQNDAKAAPSSTLSHLPKILKTREEEIAFPRGGASILTPLEHKQISIEAARDVLFEQQSASRNSDSKKSGDGEPAGVKTSVTKKRKLKSKSKKGEKQKEAEEEIIKIEGLSYKV